MDNFFAGNNFGTLQQFKKAKIMSDDHLREIDNLYRLGGFFILLFTEL